MRKTKSKTKSNIDQKTTNPRDFSFKITKVAVAQICKSVGFRRSRVSALETLTLVATKYLETLAKSAVSFSNAASRTQSNILDLTNALHDMSIQGGFKGASTLYDNSCLLKSSVLEDLSGFVSSTDEIPFAKPIETAAKERVRQEEVKESPGSLQRGAHIPGWLPEFPDKGINKKCNRRAHGEELWENSSLVSEWQPDSSEEKRNGSSGGNLPKGRIRVKFRINGGGKRVHVNTYSCNDEFSRTKDDEADVPEAELKKPVKSRENLTLGHKRRQW